MPAKIQRQDMVDDLTRIYNSLSRAPLTTEYDKIGKFSVSSFRKEFGSWRNALISCGIEPTSDNRKLNSDADIIAELDRLSNILGKSPTYTDIKKYSTISPDTFARRIGRTGIYNPKSVLESLDKNWNIDSISDQDGYWISGFVTGEGTFCINEKGGITFAVGQRADDIGNLEFTRDVMGLPKDIYTYSNSTRRSYGQKVGDEARLTTSNRWICQARVIPFFDKFQLKGRKKLDYEIFKVFVLFMCQRDEDGRYHQRFTESEKKIMRDLSNQVKALRHDPTSIE